MAGPLSRQRAVVVVAVILIVATFVLSIVLAASAFVRDVLAAPLRPKLTRSLSLPESEPSDFKTRFDAIRDGVHPNYRHIVLVW
jgi:hypothetical protein